MLRTVGRLEKYRLVACWVSVEESRGNCRIVGVVFIVRAIDELVASGEQNIDDFALTTERFVIAVPDGMHLLGLGEYFS